MTTAIPFRWKHHEELKPCPFCGGTATMFARDFRPVGFRFSVGCEPCDFTRDDRSIDEMSASALWNNRSEAAQ